MPYNFHPPDPLFPTLQLYTDSNNGFETMTDASGHYRYTDLPPHRYGITALKEGYRSQKGSGIFRTLARQDIQCDLELERPAQITGRFLDYETGEPVTGHHLNLISTLYPGGRPYGALNRVDRSGKTPGEFVISNLISGTYYLEVVPDRAEQIVVQAQNVASEPSFYGRSFCDGAVNVGDGEG